MDLFERLTIKILKNKGYIMNYLITGYQYFTNEVLTSTAETEEKAAKFAAYMLALKTVYKVEIVKSDRK